MKLRNPLFVPAESERKITKAFASSADAVILDLEDSVSPAAKAEARATAVAAVRSAGARATIVRINAADSEWGLADLAAIVPARPTSILLPKCTGPGDLARLVHWIEALEVAAGLPPEAIGVMALITETAGSLHDMNYAGVTTRLQALCYGAEDLAADLGIDPRHADGSFAAPLASARVAVIIAAARAGVPALDTPFPNPRDQYGLERECASASAHGFAGKACIHPDQLQATACAFTPDVERTAWATAVCEHFAANPTSGAFLLDGKMYDRPHLKLAERVIAAAGCEVGFLEKPCGV